MILDAKLVMQAAFWASLAGLILSGAGHFLPPGLGLAILFTRMMIAATAGYMYGLVRGDGYGRGALGGAIAGGLCAVPGFAVAVLLSDCPAHFVATGTAIAVLTGAVGGIFGQMGAILKKLGF
jgi:hypothetical protein